MYGKAALGGSTIHSKIFASIFFLTKRETSGLTIGERHFTGLTPRFLIRCTAEAMSQLQLTASSIIFHATVLSYTIMTFHFLIWAGNS